MQMQVLYRLTNDMHCNLGAVAEFDDGDMTAPPVGTFKFYGALPGMGTAHASAVYDDVSDLYFMVSNLGRNSLQPWDTEMHGPQCASLNPVLVPALPCGCRRAPAMALLCGC
jgi:hypothetical protein